MKAFSQKYSVSARHAPRHAIRAREKPVAIGAREEPVAGGVHAIVAHGQGRKGYMAKQSTLRWVPLRSRNALGQFSPKKTLEFGGMHIKVS